MSIDLKNRTQLVEQQTRFKTAYSPKIQTPLEFPIESPYTRQEFKDECDINKIIAMYEITGELNHLNESAPQYLDCTGEDFRAHMDYVAGAFSMFEELPAKIRDKFENDPAAFLDFCSHEKNRPELAQMGLLSEEASRDYFYPQGTPEVPQKPALKPVKSNDAPLPVETPAD